MSDPLSLVRKAVLAGDTLTLVDNAYALGGHQLPADTKTAFKRSLGADEHYHTLREIIFCLHNAGLSLVEYRKNCLQERLKALVEADRAALLAYLNGETSTCAQIDQQAVDSYVPPTTSSSNRNKRKADEMLDNSNSSNHNNSNSSHNQHGNSLLASNSHASAASASLGEDAVGAERLQKLRAKFFPVYASKSSIYNTVTSKDDFRSVLKIFNNAVLARSNNNNADPTATATATAGSVPSSSSMAANNTNSNNSRLKPIIVVPSALTSCINMFNAKVFLEEGRYIKPEVAMQNGVERKKVDVIVRRMNGGGQRVQLYKLIDDPASLPKEEWDRVAAVFVSGQTWQFNRWPESDPVQLFQQVLATHLMLDGRPVDAKVKAWHCHVLKVDEFKDYVNAGVASQFWLYLDDFLQRKKPHLLGSTATSVSN